MDEIAVIALVMSRLLCRLPLVNLWPIKLELVVCGFMVEVFGAISFLGKGSIKWLLFVVDHVVYRTT